MSDAASYVAPVPIAGGADKRAWAVEEFGFDACIDHRIAGLAESLAGCNFGKLIVKVGAGDNTRGAAR
jgi:NADPH-dependent curcumin reductase CurA